MTPLDRERAMNGDLISRSALLEKAMNVTKYDEGGWGMDFKAVDVVDVLYAPAVNARIYRNGKWLKRGNERICPFCLDRHVHLGGKERNYCSECGADMGGEQT